MKGPIHITVDLEDAIKKEIADRQTLPMLGAVTELDFMENLGWLHALQWVLQKSRAELDE